MRIAYYGWFVENDLIDEHIVIEILQNTINKKGCHLQQPFKN